MSLYQFVPAQQTKRQSAKRCAVPVTCPSPGGRSAVCVVTENRPPRVGWPAVRVAADRCPDDPVFRETARTGLEALRALEGRSRDVARDLRWRRAEAPQRLADLIQGLEAIVTLATTAAAARGDADGPRSQAAEVTRGALGDVIDAQTARDWSLLADRLDASFVAALRAWRMVFESFLIGPSDDTDPHGWAA